MEVVEPNASSVFYKLVENTIRWENPGNITGNINIGLFNAGVLSRVLAQNITNSLSFTWIPSVVEPTGTNYTIKISLFSEVGVIFESHIFELAERESPAVWGKCYAGSFETLKAPAWYLSAAMLSSQ